MPTRFRELFCRVYLLIHASYDINDRTQTERIPINQRHFALLSSLPLGIMIHYLFLICSHIFLSFHLSFYFSPHFIC
jgi:hypothetical protein